MLKRTRIGSSVDSARIASLVSGPGVDTRTWVSLAIALEDSVVDPDHGVLVDVRLVPTEEEYTARLAPGYAGSGFGLYHPVKKDDELVVAAPSGDPANGMIVESILWSAADKPPQEAVDNPADVLLVVEPEKNLRLKVSGGGNVYVSSEQKVVVEGSSVHLGADNLVSPNDGVVHGTGIDSFSGATYFALGNASGVVLAKK